MLCFVPTISPIKHHVAATTSTNHQAHQQQVATNINIVLSGSSIREENNINITFLVRIFCGHFWPLRPDALGSKSFSPSRARRKPTFWCGRPWPEGFSKNFVQKKFAWAFWPLTTLRTPLKTIPKLRCCCENVEFWVFLLRADISHLGDLAQGDFSRTPNSCPAPLFRRKHPSLVAMFQSKNAWEIVNSPALILSKNSKVSLTQICYNSVKISSNQLRLARKSAKID